MFTNILFWAALGYCGNDFRIQVPIPGGPPPPPDPWRLARVGIAIAGGIAGGFLSQQFSEPSMAVSGMTAFALGRVLSRISWGMGLSPQPLPPRERG